MEALRADLVRRVRLYCLSETWRGMSGIPAAVAADQEVSSGPTTQRSVAVEAVPGLASNSLLVLLASAFGNGLNYLFAMYFARALGPAEFGLYALGITVFNIAVLFAPLGMETAVMKFVSQHTGSGGMASARKFIASGAGVAAGFGLLLALGLACSSDLLATHLFGKPELSTVLSVLALGVPLAAVSILLLSSIQALGHIRWTVLIRNGVEPVGKFLLAGLAAGMGWGLHGMVGAIVAVLVVSCVVSFRCLRSLADFQFERRAIPGSLEMKAMLAFSVPLVISNLFGIVAPRSDLLAIGAYLSASDVAVYAVASQTAAVLALILSAFDAAIMQPIGGLLARKDTANLTQMSKAASRWAFTLSLFVFVQLALFAPDILRWFGPAFETGAVCLVILAMGHLIGSAAVSSTGIVLMSGHSKIIMVNSIAVGIVLIGSNLWLVPRFGIGGAAAATSICVAVNSLLCVIEAKWASGIMPYSAEHLKPLGAATLALVFGFLLKSALADDGVLLLALIVAAFQVGLLLAIGLEAGDYALLEQTFPRVEPMVRGFARGRGGNP